MTTEQPIENVYRVVFAHKTKEYVSTTDVLVIAPSIPEVIPKVYSTIAGTLKEGETATLTALSVTLYCKATDEFVIR